MSRLIQRLLPLSERSLVRQRNHVVTDQGVSLVRERIQVQDIGIDFVPVQDGTLDRDLVMLEPAMPHRMLKFGFK